MKRILETLLATIAISLVVAALGVLVNYFMGNWWVLCVFGFVEIFVVLYLTYPKKWREEFDKEGS